MGFVSEDFAGEDEWDVELRGGVEGEVKTFFGADAAEAEDEIAFFGADAEDRDGDAVRNDFEVLVCEGGLGFGDAVEVEIFARDEG